MIIEKFEDVIAWQKSKSLAIEIYRLSKNCRDFGFKDQLQRAAISILNNIAEGFERHTNKEFINFLYIAKGSCGEVRSMLHIGLELGYFSNHDYKHLHDSALEISKIISGFIKTL